MEHGMVEAGGEKQIPSEMDRQKSKSNSKGNGKGKS
jgi:hypothetical protein